MTEQGEGALASKIVSAETAKAVLAEGVRILYVGNYYLSPACAIGAALIAFVFRNSTLADETRFWAMVMWGIEAIRMTLTVIRARYRDAASDDVWGGLLTAWCMLAGVWWACLVIAVFDVANLQQTTTVLLFVIGVAAGAALQYSLYIAAAAAAGTPIVLSLAFVFAKRGTPEDMVLAAIVLIYAALLMWITHYFQRTTTRAITGRIENEALVTKLNRAVDVANSARAAQKRITANVSHEMRTPLNAIIGMLRLALTAASSEQKDEYLKVADGAAQGLLAVINDLLDLSRLEQGDMKLQSAPFAVDHLLADLADMFRAEAEDKGLAFRIDDRWPPDTWVVGDRTRIRQVIVNLVANAIKFTDAGSVTVRLWMEEQEDSQTRFNLTVEDTGIGIAPQDQWRIFDRFQRAEASPASGRPGSGLGLAICKELANAMDGALTIQSTERVGSAFTLSIPCQVCAPQAKSATTPTGTVTVQQSVHVLVVDDNEINQMLIKQLLSQVGHSVETVGNGRTALDRLRAVNGKKIDLILMDVAMPVMDGLEATRQIRCLGNGYAEVPIVAVTANAFEEQRADCAKAGMNGFVVKPIEVAALVAEINRVQNVARQTPKRAASS